MNTIHYQWQLKKQMIKSQVCDRGGILVSGQSRTELQNAAEHACGLG